MEMICAVGASGEGTGGGIEWWWNGRWRNGGGPGLVVWERVAKE